MIRYDAAADSLHIRLSEEPAATSREVTPGVHLHMGPGEQIRAVEIRGASMHMPLEDLARLVLRNSMAKGASRTVFHLGKAVDSKKYQRLMAAAQADGWELAPAHRYKAMEKEGRRPSAVVFVRRKQPA